MELYVSGVKVPPLGSSLDIVSRQYLGLKAKKEVALNKILAQIAVSNGGPENNEWARQVTSAFKDYQSQAYFLDGEVERREEDMRAEFEKWKQVRPEVVKTKDGSLQIKGIL